MQREFGLVRKSGPVPCDLVMPQLHIALCYGTRPQTIKASVLRSALGTLARVTAVDSGQHYDYALNELLYRQLGIAPADHYLGVGSGSHATQTSAILLRMEPLLSDLSPDAVAVIGDTNSTLGCALAAAKLRIPVVHVEAGLRAHDRLMAEEINRRATDAIAGLLITPSRAASERLRRERPDAVVCEAGDVARDVLISQLAHLPPLTAVSPLAKAPYIFATLHRAELVDRPGLLQAVLEEISQLSVPTVLALHPRTRRALDAVASPSAGYGRLKFIPAVGYLESLALTRGASLVLTDSGGLQREAYWLGTPCVTLRAETEWAETIELGANTLVAPADVPNRLRDLVAEILGRSHSGWDRDAYGTGHAAQCAAAATLDWLK